MSSTAMVVERTPVGTYRGTIWIERRGTFDVSEIQTRIDRHTNDTDYTPNGAIWAATSSAHVGGAHVLLRLVPKQVPVFVPLLARPKSDIEFANRHCFGRASSAG